MNEKIENTKVEVPSTIEMNDRDYLNVALELEKNMSNNFSIALNEMSNETLFNKIDQMFNDIKKEARETFELMFSKGWYTLEKEMQNKIDEKINELSNKMSELIN